MKSTKPAAALHNVTTNFFGICTHMDTSGVVVDGHAPMLLPAEFRVVLVDASTEAIINNSRLHNLGIKPHFAHLQLLREQIAAISDLNMKGFTVVRFDDTYIIWRLNNVILSIANAIPDHLTITSLQLPSLRQLTAERGVTLSNPTIMTLQAVPTRAAAYFDFFSGTLACKRYGKAAVGQLTTKTLGNPVLRVRSFAGDTNIINIELVPDPPPTIAVYNYPKDPHCANDNDFLLHYLNAEEFPVATALPGASTCHPIDEVNTPVDFGPDTTTPGCSNSTYP